MSVTNPQRPSISAFFPAYNDAGTIASMVLVAAATLRDITDDYEVVVVNDGSRDHTAMVLAELERLIPKLRVVHHPHNRGYGAALRSGFAAATKEFIFYTDGDAQYDPREVRLLLAALDDDVDLVNGYKLARNDPLPRLVVGRLYQWGVKLLFRLKLRDVDCDFRLIRRQVFDQVRLESDSGVICVELMRKIQDAGFRTTEVPVNHFHRAYGKSQFFNLPRIFHTLVGLARLWWKLVLLPAFKKDTPSARDEAAPPVARQTEPRTVDYKPDP